MEHETFSHEIWEPCCGGGHISKTLIAHGYQVTSTDLYDHGFGLAGLDFLKYNEPIDCDIVTNPPYVQAQQFAEHALSLMTEGRKLAMFLRLTFLETQARRQLFDKAPPIRVYVASGRLGCAQNGEFMTDKSGELYYPSAVAYAWFVWEKGFSGVPELHWFN